MGDLTGEQIRAAYEHADLQEFATYLHPNVRWGNDDHANRCRSKDDVLRTFTMWVGSGVTTKIAEVRTGPAGIACKLNVQWADPADKPRGVRFWHVLTVQDGLITEISRCNDTRTANRAIGL